MIVLTKKELRRALIAASSDPSRVNLRQIRIERRKDEARLVTTDGHRLHIITIDCRSILLEDYCLPADVLEFVAKIAGVITLAPKKIEGDGLSISINRDGYVFPPYRQITDNLPEPNHAWTTTPKAFRKAMRELDYEDSIGLSEEGLVVEGGDVRIFPRYLADAVKASGAGPDDEIRFAWNGHLDPVRVIAPGFDGVVMPRRS